MASSSNDDVLNVAGKVVLVTGSTRGIGFAVAKRLAQSGANVFLNGVSDAALLEERRRALEEEVGRPVQALLFDVSNPAHVADAYRQIFQRCKRLDVLVNNAGILQDRLVGMIDEGTIQATLDVNVTGVILNLQAAARLMTRNKSGSIVNVGSIVGRVGNAGQVVYGGSKAAVMGITQSAAKELAAQNIRVNAVAPGFIDTDMTRKLPADIHEQRVQSIRMGRIGTAEDVADAVLFFASDLSRYVTGQVLGVDGGMLI